MSLDSRVYRPDIDGLRAIAVLSVVLFHTNPGFLPGGFVGVDVFFVISGYLITRNIHNEIKAGRFTYSNFYVRRIRRLFPALFFTLTVTSILGFLLLSPNHLERLGQSTVYAAAALSNFYFWSETGYFDISSSYKPLLHFWSLAVEEQFYLIWPAFLLGLFCIRKLWVVIGVLCLLGISSLMLGVHWMAIDQDVVFYLMPFRIFEFTFGAICVWLRNLPDRLNAVSEVILVFGLGAIVYSSFTYNEMTIFPVPGALLPCLGAAMVIYAGHAKYSGLVLRNRLVVGIGLISYSLYLIHWPMLVYYKYLNFNSINMTEQIGLIIAALLMAALMYEYIEKPFRYKPRARHQLEPARLGFRCATLMALIVLPAAHAWANLGWGWRISDDNHAILEQTRMDNHSDCADHGANKKFGYSCQFGAKAEKQNEISFVLLGDSHSKHWVPGLNNLFLDNGVSAIHLGRGGVLPFVGGATYDNPKLKVPMLDGNRNIQNYIEEKRPKVVALSARWALYTNKDFQHIDHGGMRFFTYGQYSAIDSKTSLIALEQALSDTISRYRSLGIHTVLLGQVPPLGGSLKDCLTRPGYLKTNNSIVNCRVYSKHESLERIRSTNLLLLSMKNRFGSSVSVFLPSEWLCNSSEYCDLFSDNDILYTDDNHLSYHGSISLVNKHLSQLVEIANGGV
ncbi:MAG: acyltransferase [Gammaproteobacteria bacterium]|nr:MAG: acyltransferase [Gammaproteobacteria bacterium]